MADDYEVVNSSGSEGSGSIDNRIPITLDLNAKIPSALVSAKQGDDEGRKIYVTFSEDGNTWTIPSGVRAGFRFRKADGHVIYNATTGHEDDNINIDENTIVITLTAECLSAAGRGYADVILEDSEHHTISTSPFILDVVASPNVGAGVVSGDEFTYLQAIVAGTDNVIAGAADWAVGPSLARTGEGGEGTMNEGDKYEGNVLILGTDSDTQLGPVTLKPSDTINALYFAEVAAKYAVGGSTSASEFFGNGWTNITFPTEDTYSAKHFAEEAATQVAAAQMWAIGTNASGSEYQPSATKNAKYYADRIENLTVSADSSYAGATPSVTKNIKDEHYELHFEIPRGQVGETGPTGGIAAFSTAQQYYAFTSASNTARPTKWSTNLPGQVNNTNQWLWIKTSVYYTGSTEPIDFYTVNRVNVTDVSRNTLNAAINAPFILAQGTDYSSEAGFPSEPREGQLWFVPVFDDTVANNSGSGS